MLGNFEGSRGYNVQVGVDWVNGVGVVRGVPPTWVRWWCGGGGDVLSLFLFGALT